MFSCTEAWVAKYCVKALTAGFCLWVLNRLAPCPVTQQNVFAPYSKPAFRKAKCRKGGKNFKTEKRLKWPKTNAMFAI